MEFAFHGTVPPELAEFRAGLEAALLRRGYDMLETPDDATLVCNFVDATDARPYRRTNKWTFVASFWYAAEPPDDFVRTGYPVLLKALSNLSVCVVPDVMARFLTLEQGNYEVRGGRRARLVLRPRRRAPGAARGVEPRDREHLDARPGARAVGRRRDHRVADGRRRAAREAEPAARAVADRRDPVGRATSPT